MAERTTALYRQNGKTAHRRRPQVLDTKTNRRLRKALADSLVKPAPSASEKRIKVGDDWDGMGHSVHLHFPEELLAPSSEIVTDTSVIRALPRRKQAKTEVAEDYVHIQMSTTATPSIGWGKTLQRLGVWLGAFISFQRATFVDKLRGRDTLERRAVRLRKTFESIGGTFVKIGQQLSSRLDMLPIQYCQELANMLDNFPPFPAEEAITVIERTTGKKLDDIFSAFDPNPIGSASIACVYQAILRDTGQKVAVKVRRPNIKDLFEADFRVIELLTGMLEVMTVVRPGFMENLRLEIRTTLSSELDFRREARLCELFERRSRKLKKQPFGAPQIIFDYSNEEVLVQEFVSGIWLWEILAAVEHKDNEALARMRQLNIQPRKIARRLIFANNWGIFAHLAFHADPHPANIVVQANNKLVFVDFGACGYINSARRVIYQRTYESFLNEDPYGMAQCALAMLEPLPPMDINAITKDTETGFHNQLLAMKSKHSPWFERTTANLFLTSINVTSKYQLPVPRDYLMFTRASLLYDTMCARLDPKFNFYKEYKKFRKEAQRKAKKRGQRALEERFARGLTGGDYQMMEQTLKTGSDLLFRAQRLMSAPYDFAVLPYTIEKWTYAAMITIRFLIRAALITAVGLGIAAGRALYVQEALDLNLFLNQVVGFPLYWLLLLILAFQHVRLILFRLGDKTRKE